MHICHYYIPHYKQKQLIISILYYAHFFSANFLQYHAALTEKKLKNYEYRRFYNESSEDNLEIADYRKRKWTSGD